jgi:hypothetical protein
MADWFNEVKLVYNSTHSQQMAASSRYRVLTSNFVEARLEMLISGFDIILIMEIN